MQILENEAPRTKCYDSSYYFLSLHFGLGATSCTSHQYGYLEVSNVIYYIRSISNAYQSIYFLVDKKYKFKSECLTFAV